ncbi:MAG TPA: arginine--tRNA ligase [Candidatus Paceibacterota bacterium]|nr:arginine--tRNA ligase [Candidatus Paceibacterota bacterium]
MVRDNIEAAIKEALASLGALHVPFVVERPAEMEHGDYATNAALAAAKILKKNPRDVAEQLKEKLVSQLPSTEDSVGVSAQQVSLSAIKKIEVAGVGFINFTLAGTVVKKIVHEAHEAEWGSNILYKGKTVMVEYTDPNPFKEFHIGHLMSNAIGESIARVLEFSGANVIRANYQGDVGLHVAKAIWGKQQKPDASWGEAYAYGSAEYEANKEEIDAINKKVYEKDPSVIALYDEGRKHSLETFEKIYKTLGTKFDTYFFESETWQKGLALVQTNVGKVFEESDGAVIYRGEQDGLHTRVFVNKAGLPTYEAKDLGLLMLKKEIGTIDLSITITASEQQEYLKVVLAAAKHIAEVADIAQKTKHITHGMMRFAEGKMSSRTGNVITGESLLNDLQAEAKEKMQGRELEDSEKTAEHIAVGGIKYSVLKQASGKDIVFDPAKSLSLEGDSGPYVQYALVRARAVLRKASEAEAVDAESAEPSPLERLLVHFPEVVERAASELEPHYVVTYITELAADFNSWYASERFIIDGKVSKHTVAAVKAVENTLARGLQVLGIPAPEEM